MTNKDSPATKYDHDNMSAIVEGWIKDKKFYQKNLTIIEAAQSIGTDRKYLSAYPNHELKTTYHQWLNKLQIEYAQELFIQYPKKHLGNGKIPKVYNFSHKFKQATGISPQ